jgi:haloalkane dehalogenase
MKKSIKIGVGVFSLLIIVGAVVYSNLTDLRGNRYCEILVEYDDATEVWGTQGLNRCPQADWEQLDFKEIQLSNNANSIIANGPRYFVVNGSEGMVLPEEETRFFGNIEMQKLATVKIDDTKNYVENFVSRDNVWVFDKGEEIYSLIDKDGNEYVMQSYSLIVDKTLKESDLSNLGSKLSLPDGWKFTSRVLDAELLAPANGMAIVIKDDLGNSYQKLPEN